MENRNLIGFDNEKYLREQTAAILERVNRFNAKLYWSLEARSFMIIMHPEFCRDLIRM